jgi:hypothetical protein
MHIRLEYIHRFWPVAQAAALAQAPAPEPERRQMDARLAPVPGLKSPRRVLVAPMLLEPFLAA